MPCFHTVLLDAIVENCSVYFKSKRWTIRLSSWLTDCSVASGYLGAKYLGLDWEHDKWVGVLIDQLIEKSEIVFTTPTSLQLQPKVKVELHHYLAHVGDENDRKNCVVCYESLGKRVKTSYKCNSCGVGLCNAKKDRNCFVLYHSQDHN